MTLVERRCLAVSEVDGLLISLPSTPQCALVLVGRPTETSGLAERWLTERADLVVMVVDVVDDVVRLALRDPKLDALLTALHEMVERVGTQRRGRVARIRLQSGSPRPLLDASIDWIRALLRDAVEGVPDDNGDLHGFSLTRATLLQSLDASSEEGPQDQQDELADKDAALDMALAAADPSAEPLAAAHQALGLSSLEFRMMVLALAPELDLQFQRSIGFLLDDMGRRVGTMALYCTLLGATARVRDELAQGGALAHWRVFEGYPIQPAAADEPLRLDPFLRQWLLGDWGGLGTDPRVRRVLRLVPWPGATLLERPEERTRASQLVSRLQSPTEPWLLLGGHDATAWRALVELGADTQQVALLRVEPARLAGADLIDVEECARRVGRMARLKGAPLVIDAGEAAGTEGSDEGMRLFLYTLGGTDRPAAVICRDEAHMVRLLGPIAYQLAETSALSLRARLEALREAAAKADAYLTEESAKATMSRYPLNMDGLEHAMRMARTRPLNHDLDDPRLARFIAASKEVAAEGLSNLAERIEPVFSLDDVVLPPDRKQQLNEIVDHVRLADRVLDGWKFGDQMPYGRGVTALFFGPSGTGKTMGAMAVAHRLGIQLLRLDFSKVVSKYIGDTEKNIDCVFTGAEQSGCGILVDEADALLGKRSEVKDAHDRYANIEVAYLLQRMEAYEGLAILTTNLRQNLDPAFLRRLRFIVDFPRPDVHAREQIWRRCLPAESHTLDDAAFRQLARRLDLTGGHIRQITLRAAFIAAAADTRITLEHIGHAARAELAKLGMPPVELNADARGRAA
jgi:AAA+ superfamily predicted ATPase